MRAGQRNGGCGQSDRCTERPKERRNAERSSRQVRRRHLSATGRRSGNPGADAGRRHNSGDPASGHAGRRSERGSRNRGGSRNLTRFRAATYSAPCGGVAQLVIAAESQSVGRWFDSSPRYHLFLIISRQNGDAFHNAFTIKASCWHTKIATQRRALDDRRACLGRKQ